VNFFNHVINSSSVRFIRDADYYNTQMSMIECDYLYDPIKGHYCKKEARYIINWGNRPRPISLPFNEQNFVCEEHFKTVKKICAELRRGKVEVYLLDTQDSPVRVQFT
jgi:hypothetical protein